LELNVMHVIIGALLCLLLVLACWALWYAIICMRPYVDSARERRWEQRRLRREQREQQGEMRRARRALIKEERAHGAGVSLGAALAAPGLLLIVVGIIAILLR
jgi:hypothetical protein